MPPSSPETNMQKLAISALWAVLLLVAGWGFVDSRDARAETRDAINQIRIDGSKTTERVAVMEETIRNQKEQLNRIERAVTVKPAF